MAHPTARSTAHSAAWTAVAVLVFAVATAWTFRVLVEGDARVSVPLAEGLPAWSDPLAEGEGFARRAAVTRNDVRWLTWAWARNARTLVADPLGLFDANICHPTPCSLALTHPNLTSGLLGIPVYWATRDPVRTFDSVLVVVTFLSGLAMYLLVREWSGVPAAGVVAGLLYALGASNLFYAANSDTLWLVLGLYFARRLVAHGRWGDALAAGIVPVLQVGLDFYTTLAAALAAAPFTVWLLWHHRRGIPWSRVAVAAAIAVGGAAALLWPFLAQRASGELAARPHAFFASWSAFLPGRVYFPGGLCAVLALAGLALGRGRVLGGISGDPRWSLVASCLLLALTATGGGAASAADTGVYGPAGSPGAAGAAGGALPNVYALLASVLPGLDMVRAPGWVGVGVLPLACVLAGLGAAGLLRFAPARLATAAAALLVLVAFAERVRPFPGAHPLVVFEATRIRPDEEALAFFAELDRRGNRGPLLELPFAADVGRASLDVLRSAYHGRRTSSCYSSNFSSHSARVRELSERVPDPSALAELSRMGFTTVVVHHAGRPGSLAARVADAAAHPGSALRPIHHTRRRSAYAIGYTAPRR